MERDEWVVHRSHLQDRLWGVLGRPDGMVEPACEVRSRSSLGDVVVERIVYEVEPDQSAPALLYLPGNAEPPFPAVAIAMGHGESKTTPGPLYA